MATILHLEQVMQEASAHQQLELGLEMIALQGTLHQELIMKKAAPQGVLQLELEEAVQ